MAQDAKQPRIVIIGAGPAGLSTAYYLRKAGYTEVTVLEKLGRVGGLCKSVTSDGHSFDLGANYTTLAYKEVLKIAKDVGATTYVEKPFVAMEVPEDPTQPTQLKSLFDVMRIDEKTGKEIPLWKFTAMTLKFVALRQRLSHIIDKPTMAGIENYPELCQPFGDWLEQNGIGALERSFELPITMMGYGRVTETPAIYALKFMTLATFIPMAIKEVPLIGRLIPWPKRFTQGFQRLWERVSWDLDVRMNIDIQSVERGRNGALIKFRRPEQEMNELQIVDDELHADFLILACPLRVVHKFMKINEQEEWLFSQIRSFSYCMTTFHVDWPEAAKDYTQMFMAAVFPQLPVGDPIGVARQSADSNFVQYYSPLYDVEDPGGTDGSPDEVKRHVIERVREVTTQMGGTIAAEGQEWHSFDRFTYFQHVLPESLRAGFYSRLEAQQGMDRTYYVGGATNFELIEPIAEYAKNLVATHFPRQNAHGGWL